VLLKATTVTRGFRHASGNWEWKWERKMGKWSVAYQKENVNTISDKSLLMLKITAYTHIHSYVRIYFGGQGCGWFWGSVEVKTLHLH